MTVQLSKGQRVSLQKSSQTPLAYVSMGLGWNAKPTTGFFGRLFSSEPASIDLDASCLLLNEEHELIDVVWFRQLQSTDGSIVHQGDNRTGEGEGDDEVIQLSLLDVPTQVHSLVFVVNSFTGQTFDAVEQAYCRLVDTNSSKELARYTLSEQGAHTSLVMARLYRDGTDWTMQAIGEAAEGRTFHDLLPTVRRLLAH